MFGGWDGSSDLSDLWQFTVQTSLWECLSTDASQEVKWCNCSLLSCLVFVGRSQWPLLSQNVLGLQVSAAVHIGPLSQSFPTLAATERKLSSSHHPCQHNFKSIVL